VNFENTFAGSLALGNWLASKGYQEISIEIDEAMDGLSAAGLARTTPKCGLFGDVRPLAERLKDAAPERVVELVFGYHSDVPTELRQAIKAIPPELRLPLCQRYWEESRGLGRDVTWQALLVIQDLGPIAADWTRAIWHDLVAENRDYAGFATKALASSLPPDEAFALAKQWMEKAAHPNEQKERLLTLGNVAHRETLRLIERWWESTDAGTPVTEEWGRLAADSRLTWSVAETWLQRGRPMCLIALDAMLNYLPRRGYYHVARPTDFGLRNTEAFQNVLTRYGDHDPSPRAKRAVDHLIENAKSFVD
jgi:hypothetical protein